jgi:hypothetical protein
MKIKCSADMVKFEGHLVDELEIIVRGSRFLQWYMGRLFQTVKRRLRIEETGFFLDLAHVFSENSLACKSIYSGRGISAFLFFLIPSSSLRGRPDGVE